MIQRVKTAISNIGYFLAIAIVLWTVIGGTLGSFIDVPGSSKKVREGQPCGPGYRCWPVLTPCGLV